MLVLVVFVVLSSISVFDFFFELIVLVVSTEFFVVAYNLFGANLYGGVS